MDTLRAAAEQLHYSNAHNSEAVVTLYERAEDGLRCYHDIALNTSKLCSRLLQILLGHGMAS